MKLYLTTCRLPAMLVFFFFFFFTSSAIIGQGLLTGTISNEKTGEPLAKAKVEVPGLAIKIVDITDKDGKYEIPKPPSGSFLTIAARGFLKKTITILDDKVIDVALEAKPKKVKKIRPENEAQQGLTSTETSARAKISTTDFNQGIISDPALLLQGKVAGLQIYNLGGDPSQEPFIRIRGISSFEQNTEPLIVIDGIPGLSMQNVDPFDIESFEILKDASAAARYGIRGASGVIKIKTKSGKTLESGLQLSYHGQLGFSQAVEGIALMSAEEFVQNGGRDLGSDTDWVDEITQARLSQAHHLSLGGTSGKTHYRISGNVRSQDGVLRNTGFDQFNGRMNFSTSLFKDKLIVDFNSAITNSLREVGFAEAFRYAQTFNPTAPVFGADAPFAFNEAIYGGYYENIGLFDSYNPVSMVEQNRRTRKSSLYNASANLSYALFKFLKLNLRVGRQSIQQDDRIYYPTTSLFRGNAASLSRKGQAEFFNATNSLSSLEGFISTNNEFGNSRLKVQAGYYFQRNNSNSSFFSLGDFPDTTIDYINQIEASQDLLNRGFIKAESDRSPDERIIAFYGNVQYALNDFLFLDASMRREGSTRLGEDKKWGMFPAVSTGLDFNQFLQLSKVELLKLRIGYGQSGGLPGTYALSQWVRSISTAVNSDFSTNVLYGPNPDLQWEQKEEINIGVDFKTNRFSGTVDWYNQNTSDFILKVAIPLMPGSEFREQFQNVGRVKTTGLELSLQVDLIKNENWKYNTGVIFSRYKSILEEYYQAADRLGNPGAPGNGATFTLRLKEGEEIGQIWGRLYEGVDADGLPIYADVNGDDQLQVEEVFALEEVTDFTDLGKAIPDFELGWSNQLNYKGWTLNAFFRGAFGHSLVNNFRLFYESNLNGQNPYNYVNTELRDAALNTSRFSSHFVEKASFLKLDNLTLSKKIALKNLKSIDNLSIYLTAQNLLTITKYTGTNPEPVLADYGSSVNGELFDYSSPNLLAPGVDRRNNYFPSRSILLGVHFDF